MSYTHVLKDELQEYSFDPIEEDYRDDLQNFNARSVVNGSINWDISNFNTTLYAFRLGSMPNWQETDRLPTWTIYNATATLTFMEEKLAVTGIINNVLDTRPPYDDGFDTWPFFFRGQYNARGREAFLQLRYTFE
jgi:outer membrane receptor protein involved in Fe transport